MDSIEVFRDAESSNGKPVQLAASLFFQRANEEDRELSEAATRIQAAHRGKTARQEVQRELQAQNADVYSLASSLASELMVSSLASSLASFLVHVILERERERQSPVAADVCSQASSVAHMQMRT